MHMALLGTGSDSVFEGHLYRSLAAMLGAGLSPLEAVTTLQAGDAQLVRRLAPVVARLKQGQSFAKAIAAAHWHSAPTLELLAVAERAGKLPVALQFLATGHDQRRARMQKLKAQLWLPGLVLLLGLAAAVWLHVVRHQQSVAAEMGSAALSLFAVYVVTRGLLGLLSRDGLQWLGWLWQCNLVRPFNVARLTFEHYWYALLLWQLEAGCDAQTALRQMAGLLASKKYRAQVQSCQHRVAKGGGLTAGLAQCGLLLSPELKQLLAAGEQAGALTSALQHQLALQRARLEQTLALIFEWIPRAYYLLILLVVLRHLKT
jgi:type II secretory pathway component PulF